ncbi:MAG: type II secretion system protein M [Pseudomonadota bacterium]
MFDQIKETVRNFYQQLAPRERILVLWGGAIAAIMLFYVSVWYPIVGYRDETAQAVKEQQNLLNWMRQSAAEVKQLGGGARGGVTGESLLSVADRTARMNKLADALKRVEPEGENRVRVWLEQAAFDDLVAWLERIQTENRIRIDTASIDKENAPGRVTARLVLEGGR